MTTSGTTPPVTWLEEAGQRLGLLPGLGGGLAAWQRAHRGRWVDLLRPWDGRSLHPGASACQPLAPWSNRVSQGGFTQDGHFHPLWPNTAGDPYPIHGDAWLQPWELVAPSSRQAVMRLRSRGFNGGPHDFEAEQQLTLDGGGLTHRLSVRHLGPERLPYGLGLHPWFPRTQPCEVQAAVQGVWHSHPDRLPLSHARELPADWDLHRGIAGAGRLIDNAFTGWDGRVRLRWPTLGLSLHGQAQAWLGDQPLPGLCCVVYRPEAGDAFCFEPVTHPIDAFHLPDRPGLVELAPGQSLVLQLRWDCQPD
ncbi:aldose 1-epimerase [Ideonella sp. B508-1]|uniref:aldose 1-epimerase n=1 Tax=Ideonella sp. B508-1 TaxID=137716 RepID=UPI00034C4A70|nr:aldose 1-epimerase [Ideonella sp. B508-1]